MYGDLDTTGWVKITEATKVEDVTVSKYYNYLVELDENGRIIRRSVIRPRNDWPGVIPRLYFQEVEKWLTRKKTLKKT